uniref:Uncharacterized protein n=1 Tax=Siphoviridae sp. ctXOZ1 TaxID=2823585 RepID=A0A8S5LB96_9CAUD|nr:MAG TPA: hypothetical protein [Siphoviridae sp. ctXOZ1]
MGTFKKGDVVFHKKKHFIGYVSDDDLDIFSVATPKGVVEGMNPQKFIKLSKALSQDHSLREEALRAAQNLPVGSVGLDNSGDLWTKTEEGWKGALYRPLSFDVWFSSSTARIYPAIPKNDYISKKEASCVES